MESEGTDESKKPICRKLIIKLSFSDLCIFRFVELNGKQDETLVFK